MGGIAAAGMVLQFALHNWDAPAFHFRSLEECIRCRADQVSRELWIGVQAVDALDIGDRRAPAVIADAVETHEFVDRFFHLASTTTGMDFHILAPRKILERDA